MRNLSSILIVHSCSIEQECLSNFLCKKGYRLYGRFEDMYEAITSIPRDARPPDLTIFNLDRRNVSRGIAQVKSFEFIFEKPVLITTGLRNIDLLPHLRSIRTEQILYKPFTWTQLARAFSLNVQLRKMSFAEKLVPFT